MNYQYLRDKPTRFESLTGYTLEEFSSLLPYFTKHFLEYYATKTLDGKPRIKRRYSTYKSSCLPSFEDKLLFILVYLRKATTQDVQGELFGMSRYVSTYCEQMDPPSFVGIKSCFSRVGGVAISGDNPRNF